MIKKAKKMIGVVLVLVLTLMCTVSAFAEEQKSGIVDSHQNVTNEYESIISLQKKSIDELLKQGYTETDIQTIQNADELFDKHIAFLATLSDSCLLNSGYSQKQIANIRSYDAKTANVNDRLAVSAQCVTTSVIDNYTGTTGRVTSNFSWNGIPAFKMTDILITAWNNWQITGKSANVKYTHIYGTQSSFWQAPTYQLPSSGMTSYGSGYRYPAALQDNYYYASQGYSIFVLSRQSSSHLETIARVSHQQGVANVSFSISSGFDIGLSVGRVLLGSGHAIKP